MEQRQTEVFGTLQADGTLVLDEKPNLPAGRVRVVLQTLCGPPSGTDAWAALQAIWAERQRLGLQPRTAEEIDAALSAMRDEWESHQRALEQIQEEARRVREKPPC